MKALGRNTVLVILLFASARASAQCSGTPTTVSYDSTVTGTGNDFYTFTFPEFDPTIGTLSEVNIDAIVTRSYGFQLENTSGATVSNYRVRFTGEEEITSSVLLDPLFYTHTQNYGPYVLQANDGVPSSGPDYINRTTSYVLNNRLYSTTVYNTADYMGTGSLEFNYSTLTYNSLIGSPAVDYTGGIVQDEITFRITYNYCPAIILAADITSFTAGRKGNGTIDIKWLTKNEKPNRKYELQKSTDGRVYRSVTELAAQAGTETGSYSYTYQAQPDENNRIVYFRIKLKESDGKSRLSAVRAVKASARPVEQPMLYPNPAKGATTLLLSNTKRSNWEVEVMTLSGQLVKRYIFNNAQMARLNEHNELQRGLYIIRSVDKISQEQFVQRLLVQ
jgi:hypothetical protein